MGDTPTEHIQSRGTSPQDDNDDTQWRSQSVDETSQNPEGGDGATEAEKPTGPVQKRRRVTRACDECRRKKVCHYPTTRPS